VRLTIHVYGRPAPQGSKDLGGAGQLLEQSPYLPAWRVAVKRGAYEAYREAGIDPARLPLFAAGVPVTIERCWFYVTAEQCRSAGTDEPVGGPDIDKLLRAALDPLGGAKRGSARVFADDAQVTCVKDLQKRRGVTGGALIIIREREAKD
jgi:crossover junction endodeoxyribonuclease RusA